ncbi:hypothetical membrane protein [Rhodococcus opacus B4]|uniref:Hypothetical membrane protein n=2 Tax=Rhodococcus opacus TaxID=37919 RepID=C1AV74_RHOOB|nr:hypothetical membrane protein [Rhodococcus opacus B4]
MPSIRKKPENTLREELAMIAIGVVLLVVGLVVKISSLWIAGLIVGAVGLLLLLLGLLGRKVGGRKYWY